MITGEEKLFVGKIGRGLSGKDNIWEASRLVQGFCVLVVVLVLVVVVVDLRI